MRRRPEAFLWDAIQACRKVAVFINGVTVERIKADELLQSALPYELMKIGESLNSARRNFPELEDAIPDLPQIVDFRNFLVHVYFAIDYEKLLHISSENVPKLLVVLESLWESFESQYALTEEAWDADAPKGSEEA